MHTHMHTCNMHNMYNMCMDMDMDMDMDMGMDMDMDMDMDSIGDCGWRTNQ